MAVAIGAVALAAAGGVIVSQTALKPSAPPPVGHELFTTPGR
jgi:hypothetical protein